MLRPLYILYCYSCVIMGKGYGDYARLNLKPIQVENLFSTKNPAWITDMRK